MLLSAGLVPPLIVGYVELDPGIAGRPRQRRVVADRAPDDARPPANSRKFLDLCLTGSVVKGAQCGLEELP